MSGSLGSAALKNAGQSDGLLPINPISQDVIDDPRARLIRRYTQNWINGQIAIETRLRDTRGEITNLKNFLHGDTLSPANLATLAEVERKARFRAAVRAVGAALEATEGATAEDGTWPNLSDFTAQALSPFWLDGVAMSAINGLSASFAGKTSPADVDAQIQAFYDNVAPETLALLTQLATDLDNHESMEATILAAVATEASTRATADTTEATARAAGDTTNANAVTAEAAARLSADNTETARAIAAENTVAASVTTEATARAAADTAEASTRAASDATNATAIATELTARASADTTNATAISSEATTRASADSALTSSVAGKEPSITGGTTAQYWRGDKGWRDFATDVRAALLTGLSLVTSTVVSATDSVLIAIGKLQAQITAEVSRATAAEATKSTASVIQNLSISGASYTLVPAAGAAPIRTFAFITTSTANTAITIGETGIAQGSELKVINVGSNAFIMQDTAGVSESSGNFTVGANDVIHYIYTTSAWVESGRSNN